MSKLQRLITEAKQSCAARGHNMGKFTHYVNAEDNKRVAAWGNCEKCGAYVRVVTMPYPNEIEIAGDALAVKCDEGAK